MKASRAPGAVQSTYVQLHQQKQRENQTGISNKTKNEQRKKSKESSNVGQGGILNKFKSLDDIPDYPMDENIQWKDSHNVQSYAQPVSQSNYSQYKQDYNNDNDYEDEEERNSYYPSQSHAAYANYSEAKYSQARDQSPRQQEQYRQPPPLPANLVNNNHQKKPQQVSFHHQHSYQDDYNGGYQSNHIQDSQRKSEHKPDYSSDEEEAEDYPHYYPPTKEPAPQRVMLEVDSVAVPKKKDKSLSPRRKVVNNNGQTPPPLPCENPQPSPPPAKVIPEHEKLFYSKEPRAVEYKPYTLNQYKLIKPKEYVEISKIKPDLNTEELVEKRKKLDKIKEFSKQLRQVNKEAFLQQPKLPPSTEQADILISKKKYESNRIRAMEYAKQIPKPKLPTSSTANPYNEEGEGNNEYPGNSRGGVNGGGLYMDEDAFESAKLQELEARHQAGKARLEAIKKSISQK